MSPTRPRRGAHRSPRSPRRASSRASSNSSQNSTPEPTARDLLSQSKQTTDDWYKSARMKKGYASYVKSGKELLAEWSADDNDPNASDASDHVGLAGAFDSISEKTPTALRLLVAYKCDHLGRGFSTAEGLRSAFKDYFERVHNCQGDMWRQNSYTGEWEGNPVFEPAFKAYYESLKNRDNCTGVTTQALPMLPADLKIIMDYLDSKEAAAHLHATKHLYFKAFAMTAFFLWTRNDELINLQMKHVQHSVSETGEPFFKIRLVFCKTNKDKTK
ncbi:hypothetical protein DXG03_003345, partial [Asterophora parasitica]